MDRVDFTQGGLGDGTQDFNFEQAYAEALAQQEGGTVRRFRVTVANVYSFELHALSQEHAEARARSEAYTDDYCQQRILYVKELS